MEEFHERFYHFANSDENNSIFIIFLTDIWALSRKNFYARGEHDYILDRIDRDERARGAFLLFDLSHEGHPLVIEAFNDLHSWAISRGRKLDSIGLLSQNRALEENYYRVFGPGIRFFTFDLHIARIAKHFSEPEEKFLERYGFSKTFNLFDEANEIDYFLCLNATPRPMRLALLAALKEDGILENTRWSLLKDTSGKPASGNLDRLLEEIGRSELLYIAENFIQTALDTSSDGNSLVEIIDANLYKDTIVSIVSETEFSSGGVDRITEKTLKALIMGHVPIIVGNPGSLKLVREMGFHAFDEDLINDYDEILNTAERFAAIMKEIKRINLIRPDMKERRKENCRFARSSFWDHYKGVIGVSVLDKLDKAIATQD